MAQAVPGAYPRKIDPFGLILALLESFLRLAPGLRQILTSQGRLVGTTNISTLSYALASRLHRDLVMAMLGLLSSGQVSKQDDILVLDSMAVSIPKSRQHNCAKMNNQTVGGGVLWSFCITAKREVCPVRVLKIMEGALHDSTVVNTVELVAKGPLHIMDRGFYAIDLLNRWLGCGIRFLIRARGKDLVQAAIERVLAGHRGVLAKKISHRAAIESLAVQTPLAARIEQAINDKRLQHIQPLRALAALRQTLVPELVELEKTSQPQREETSAPLPRAVQLDPRDADAERLATGRGRRLAIIGEQRQLPRLAIERLDRAHPPRMLRIVELSQVQHLPLQHPATMHAPTFHHREVAMHLAVFLPSPRAQEHNARTLSPPRHDVKILGLHHNDFREDGY